nr:cytochrome P450 [Streptomyces sp. SID13031]
MTVITDLLGVPRADRAKVKAGHDHTIAALFSGPIPLDQRLHAAHGSVEYQRYLLSLINDRRTAPRDDFVTDLVNATDGNGDRLDDAELVWLMFLMISGGHETTSSMIGTTLWLLLNDQAQYQKVLAQPDQIAPALEEMLRHTNPLLTLRRTTTRQVELAGVSIPAQAHLGLLHGSGNLDERIYSEPSRFDISRTTVGRPHLSFGHGIHFCVGAHLARLEGKVALEVLLNRLPRLRLGSNSKPTFQPHPLFHSLTRLEVAWDAERAR